MRITPSILFCLTFPLPLLSGQTALSAEGRQAASAMVRAGWTSSAESPDIVFTARLAAVCTPAVRNALDHLDDLPEVQKEAFAEWAKIEFRREGWFFRTRVEKGKYTIGLSLVHGEPMFTLRKAGKKIANSPFWFSGNVPAHPLAEVQQRKGATLLVIRFNNITLRNRFVPIAAHDALTRDLAVYGKGRVKIRSDLGCQGELKKLASWLDKAMAGSERFLGLSQRRQSYELYLFATKKGYQDVDQLMTEGTFANNWAFTSNLNQVSYLYYHPHAEPLAFEDLGIPLRLKLLSLHELQHALLNKGRPLLSVALPTWLTEALAERGVKSGLDSVDPKLGKVMHQRHLTRMAFARADKLLPAYQDVLDWRPGSQSSESYSAAYLFSYRGLPKDLKSLPGLLDQIGKSGFPHMSLFALREAGFSAAAYSRGIPSGKPKIPLRIRGDYDLVGKSLRIISAKDSNALILLPQRAGKDKVQVKGSMSWHPLGSRQADVYLAYRRGRRSSEFLKLALMPARIVLFSFRSGRWFQLAEKDYDQDLPVGSAKERSWHRFTIDLDAKSQKFDLAVGKDRHASFALPGNVDLPGSRVGLGVYNGIAWFKDVQIR